MAKILIIESYLSKENSLSVYALEKFIDEYKKMNPNDEFIYLDLNKEEKIHTSLSANNFATFWNEESQKYIDLVSNADKIIVSTGMVNFSISPLLKNFLDNILVANKTFRYKYDGKGKSEGLLNPNIKVQLIMAQGADVGTYPFGLFDEYLELVFKFIGIKSVSTLLFDGTKTPNQINLSLEQKFNLKKEEFNKQVKEF